MKNILILYPDEFKCFSKFERKVLRILSNLDDFSVSAISDRNSLIKRLCSDSFPNSEFEIDSNFNLDLATHAVIFDDGEGFKKEIKFLKNKNIPIRLIKIKITRVINIKKETQYKGLKSSEGYEYIGRGAKWGNPHSMFEEGDDRDEVIRKYKYDFDFDKFPHLKKEDVHDLAGKRLGCFCKPASCHGDVLADYLNSWDDGE